MALDNVNFFFNKIQYNEEMNLRMVLWIFQVNILLKHLQKIKEITIAICLFAFSIDFYFAFSISVSVHFKMITKYY